MVVPKKEKKFLFMEKIDRLLGRDQGDKKLSYKLSVDKYYQVYSRTAQKLKEVLQFGPTVLIINGGSLPLIFYRKGIITSRWCKPDYNHAVLAVGYGLQEDVGRERQTVEYVIIKNSWGAHWGDGGYAKISMAQRSQYDQGICGIYQEFYAIKVKVDEEVGEVDEDEEWFD